MGMVMSVVRPCGQRRRFLHCWHRPDLHTCSILVDPTAFNPIRLPIFPGSNLTPAPDRPSLLLPHRILPPPHTLPLPQGNTTPNCPSPHPLLPPHKALSTPAPSSNSTLVTPSSYSSSSVYQTLLATETMLCALLHLSQRTGTKAGSGTRSPPALPEILGDNMRWGTVS